LFFASPGEFKLTTITVVALRDFVFWLTVGCDAFPMMFDHLGELVIVR